jgi:hypothetical protein
MKKLFLLFCFVLSNTCSAQAINERWIGTWQSETGQKITITSSVFDKCTWVNKPAEPKRNCFAFYGEPMTKKRMVEDSNSDQATLNQMINPKRLSAEDIRNKNNFLMTRKNLNQISDDTFKTINFSYPLKIAMEQEGEGAIYFLDKEFIYAWSSEAVGGVLMIILTQYHKVY